jgi:hypothetical protein
MTRIVDVCQINVGVAPLGTWVPFDEEVAVGWLTRAVEVVEGLAALPRRATFREAKKTWGHSIGLETSGVPRSGVPLASALAEVRTEFGTLTFIVGRSDKQAYVSLAVENASAGTPRHEEIREWMADYFCEMVSFFSSAPSFAAMTYLSMVPDVTALVECQAWRYDPDRRKDLTFPAWALALTGDQRALLPDDVRELTPPGAVVPVVRAPFPATSRERLDWESWFRVLEPVVGPIDFEALAAGDNLVPQ